MKNAFTVDVEDYYQVEAFSSVISRTDWSNFESRVENNTRLILDLLDEKETRGTFFVLGNVARRHPSLVREIADRGHEIASHGMSHTLIYTQTPELFQQETHDSKALLEDLSQQEVIGYRAATYSITEASLWALDILVEEGFRYDSSIFPARHDRYGIPDSPLAPHVNATPKGQSLIEFPVSVLPLGPVKMPIAGGGFFRLYPYSLTRWALTRLNKGGQQFMFYIHPWEVDPDQPRIKEANRSSRFRHYLNLHRCESRLQCLMDDFEFTPMSHILESMNLLTAQ